MMPTYKCKQNISFLIYLILFSVHGDIVVVDLLSENNWTTATNEIAFNSSNAEDGIYIYNIQCRQEF